MKHIISFSGGVDSTTALLRVLEQGDQAVCVGFDYGQRHLVELEFAQKTVQTLTAYGYDIPFRILNVRDVFQGLQSALLFASDVPVGEYSALVLKQTIVPNRNAIFASILYAIAVSNGYDSIVFGVHAGDRITYPDCREDFWSQLQRALQLGNESNIILSTPFVRISKVEVVSYGLRACANLQIDFNDIYKSCWSSYDPNFLGLTSTDIERKLAFEANGVRDPFEGMNE